MGSFYFILNFPQNGAILKLDKSIYERKKYGKFNRPKP